jgi:hypothetical protein
MATEGPAKFIIDNSKDKEVINLAPKKEQAPELIPFELTPEEVAEVERQYGASSPNTKDVWARADIDVAPEGHRIWKEPREIGKKKDTDEKKAA